MARLQVRIDDGFHTQLMEAARERGFANLGAFIRRILTEAVHDDGSRVEAAEERITSSLDAFSKDIRKLHTADQALYASFDTFVRIFLTCIPDPPSDTLTSAKMRGQQRYKNYLLNVARNVNGDARAALAELANHG